MAEVRVDGAAKAFRPSTGFLGSSRTPGQRSREYSGLDAPGEPQDSSNPATFGDGLVHALDDVSLTIRNGETMAIIGPSGCGKTTLLRVISGLETLDSGRIYYDDEDVTEVAPKDRGIGIVFQNYALYPHMESKKNLAFFFWMHKRENEVDERVRITSEILGVGFDELLERKPKTLSGGQQQRVAIGRCIIRDPRLFLFDEPLSNLDAKLRTKTRVEIKRLLNRFKITAVYVTHDQVEAIALGDRICVMRHGRIEQVGTYWDVFDRPVNQFVAGFVGLPSMNFLPATVVDGRLRLVVGSVDLPKALRDIVTPDQTMTVGVRPQHVFVSPRGEADQIPAMVEIVEPIPSERVQIVHLLVGGVPKDTEITASVPLENRLQRGDEVAVSFDPKGLHFFDPVSERRLTRD